MPSARSRLTGRSRPRWAGPPRDPTSTGVDGPRAVATLKELDTGGKIIGPALAVNASALTYAVGGQFFNLPLPR